MADRQGQIRAAMEAQWEADMLRQELAAPATPATARAIAEARLRVDHRMATVAARRAAMVEQRAIMEAGMDHRETAETIAAARRAAMVEWLQANAVAAAKAARQEALDRRAARVVALVLLAASAAAIVALAVTLMPVAVEATAKGLAALLAATVGR